MTGFKEEVANEVLGHSSKRWGLLLLAVLVGATAAFWLTNRTRPAAIDDAPTPAEPADDAGNASSGTTRSTAAAAVTTAWTRISQPRDALRTLPGAQLLRRPAAPEPTD
jgi:hypothetical protein